LILFINYSHSQYTKLLDFDGSNSTPPFGSLVSDGTYLYGMTERGWVNDLGVIFKLGKNLVGVEGFDNGSVNLNPNPTIGIFQLSSEKIIQRISIFSLVGELLHRQTVNEKQLSVNLNNYPTGLYFVELYIENKRILKKVVKK
jgi:hypothetical protein